MEALSVQQDNNAHKSAVGCVFTTQYIHTRSFSTNLPYYKVHHQGHCYAQVPFLPNLEHIFLNNR